MKASLPSPHVGGNEAHLVLPAAVHKPRRARVVLLAEDDDDLRLVMECVLLTMGYRVIPVANASFALQAFHRAPWIDLLLTDVEMPGLSGLDLARALADQKACLPILFITGSVMDTATLQELASHGWAYLSKPVRVPVLRAALRSLLGKDSRIEICA